MFLGIVIAHSSSLPSSTFKKATKNDHVGTQNNVGEPIGGSVGAGDAFVGSSGGADVGTNVGETKGAPLGADVD